MKINRTVQRALTVLSLVANTPQGLTLSEMESTLDIPKTSLYDVVTTLEHLHYLRKHGKNHFIGFKPRDIGRAYAEKQDLCDVAEPLLADASESLNVISSLVLLSNTTLDYCFQYHPENSIDIARRPSPYDFLHASSTGKVLLAYMTPSRRDALLQKIVMHKFTEHTIADMDSLLENLKVVRKRGFALDDREYSYQQQCVGAPIFHRNKVCAAISFSGLNLFTKDYSGIVAEVLTTARNISSSYERL